jgi:hypothetical protein
MTNTEGDTEMADAGEKEVVNAERRIGERLEARKRRSQVLPSRATYLAAFARWHGLAPSDRASKLQCCWRADPAPENI